MEDFGNKALPKYMSSHDNTTTSTLVVDLPKDIIVDILSRLAVKSLLRFKSVSKEWCSLISEPQFIKLHLNQSNKNNHLKRLVVVKQYDSCLWSIDCKLSYYNEHDKVGLTRLHIPIKAVEKYMPASVLCSCNGLVCLIAGLDFLLCNPFTGDYRKLPTPTINPADVCAFSLGYDSSIDDFKLVIFSSNITDPPMKISILQVKTNSWRMIGIFPYCIFLTSFEGTQVNGAIHFLVQPAITRGSHLVILTLNLAEEKVTEMPQLGDSIISNEECSYYIDSIWVLRGCLSMVRKSEEEIQVWLMKEYGVQNSWSNVKTYRSNPDQLTIHMIMMELVHNQEELIESTTFLEYVMNKKERVCNILGNISGSASHTSPSPWTIATATYMESLVSPNGGHYSLNAIQLQNENENSREDEEEKLKEASQLAVHDFSFCHRYHTIYNFSMKHLKTKELVV